MQFWMKKMLKKWFLVDAHLCPRQTESCLCMGTHTALGPAEPSRRQGL